MKTRDRALASLFLGLVGGSFITASIIIGTVYGLVIAVGLFVVFTYVSPSKRIKTISFELGYTFALACVGGLLSLLVFSQLAGGFPVDHPQFWPGTAIIIVLTVAAGYILSPEATSIGRS